MKPASSAVHASFLGPFERATLLKDVLKIEPLQTDIKSVKKDLEISLDLGSKFAQSNLKDECGDKVKKG